MSQVTYSNIAVTKVLLLRGNTIQNNRYIGLPGEPTVDTQLYELRIHDGSTPGGHVVQSQTSNLVNGSYTLSLNGDGTLTAPGGINFPNGIQLSTQGTGNNDNLYNFTANVNNDINGIQVGEGSVKNITIYTAGTIDFYSNTAGDVYFW